MWRGFLDCNYEGRRRKLVRLERAREWVVAAVVADGCSREMVVVVGLVLEVEKERLMLDLRWKARCGGIVEIHDG